MRGLVLRVSGLQSIVESNGQYWQCEIRGRLKSGRRQTSAPLATGDWVEFKKTTDSTGIVESRLPRNSKISRMSSGERPYEQVIAANIDQFAIVVAVKHPTVSPGFIDRALVTAMVGQVEPIICLNKIDLLTGSQSCDIEEIYGSLGFRILKTSCETGEGLEVLEAILADRMSALVGQSGVGKSTLLNKILPGIDLPTSGLMKKHDRGRHTTTSVHLHSLPKGGYVADTPGIKGLQLWGVLRHELVKYFTEMAPYVEHCQFRDCSHIHEPSCAIRSAVKSGSISSLRYEGFQRIATSLPRGSEWQN